MQQHAEKEILAAWKTYSKTEKYGIAFGEVCYKWQQRLATNGGVGNKGLGIYATLHKLNIPIRTAYWWIQRYKESVGLAKEPLMSSLSDTWCTPKDIVDRVVLVLRTIDLDPCSDPGKLIPASKHFTEDDDGLSRPWFGHVYMNPPYGDAIGSWTDKLIAEHRSGNVSEAIALVPARVDTLWFKPFNYAFFISGRLKFSGSSNSAPFPSALLYLGENTPEFKRAFIGLGDAWRKDV